ncbi:YhjD/YihY/BrkB family envelope integrity protein [Lyngbya aestuarii]|uniref:YhjD/YihY/BrkB family envelope integrity protein n=1 Tax=Lyngbya aestuarii TaxID=118322 RepID=UPI00403D5EDB
MINPKIIFKLLKETFQEWQKDKASRLAAALAYYTVFSLAPLLVIAIATAGLIFGKAAARGEIVGQIQGVVGTSAAELIQSALDNANQPDISSVASLISIGVLLFGASGVFAQLQDALNTVWNVQPKSGAGIKNFITKRLLSFLMVLSIGIFLLVFMALSAFLSVLSKYQSALLPGFGFLWQILNYALSFSLIILLFAIIYKFLPDAKIAWRDVWMGAIITALFFTIGNWLLGWYLGTGSLGSTYGAAGSLMVLLAWVYYSSQIFLFGAEFTQVYAKKYGSRIVPDGKTANFTQRLRRRRR